VILGSKGVKVQEKPALARREKGEKPRRLIIRAYLNHALKRLIAEFRLAKREMTPVTLERYFFTCRLRTPTTFRLFFLAPPTNSSSNKAIELSIKDGLSIAHLKVSSMILNHLIGMEDVRANLITP
jgi:hypothetical protein